MVKVYLCCEEKPLFSPVTVSNDAVGLDPGIGADVKLEGVALLGLYSEGLFI